MEQKMKRVGLFVGIDHYKNGISQLQCAVNDAQHLSFAFAGSGYEVDFLPDEKADSNSIVEKVIAMTKNLKAGDLFVFYFSGHGREFNGVHYLAGVNSHPESEYYDIDAFPIPRLVSLTNKIPGLNRLFILDCCRSNILADKSGIFACNDARDISLKNAVSQGGSPEIIPPLILNSCSTGEQSFEDLRTKHGYFTKILLSAVKNPEIRNFRQFESFLQVTGTPRKQHVSWTGNLSHWDDVILFDSWEQNILSEEEKKRAIQHEISYLKSELESLLKKNRGYSFSKMEDFLKLADYAEANQEPDLVVYYYRTAIGQLKTDLRNLEELEREKKDKNSPIQDKSAWKKAVAQNIVFSDDKRTLLECPENVAVCAIPRGVTEIGKNAFAGCKNLKSVTIPKSIVSIGEGAFSDCYSILKIEIPKGVVEIGKAAFKGCENMVSVTVPGTVQTIGEEAFACCRNLRKVSLAKGIVCIEARAFESCKILKTVKIPSSLLKIGSSAFRWCEKLKTISFPESVEDFGKNIFWGCDALYKLTIPKNFDWRKTEISGLDDATLKHRRCAVHNRRWSLFFLFCFLLMVVMFQFAPKMKYEKAEDLCAGLMILCLSVAVLFGLSGIYHKWRAT